MTSLFTASTLSSSSISSSTSSELYTPPPPSQHSFLQVPDVFVIPPEEEHGDNPPFCYYDAASESKLALSFSPDMETLDVALNFYQQTDNQAPTFHRSLGNESQETIVMPRSRNPAEGNTRTGAELRRSALEDADVVEVVKMRRNEGLAGIEEAAGYPMKKSKTFRARATQAFRSIKNLNSSKSSRKPIPVTEIWPEQVDRENIPLPTTNDQNIPPRPSTPNLVRRKSIQLSQLFGSTRVAKPPPSPAVETPSPEWSTVNRPSLALEDLTNSPTPASPPVAQDHPTLSTKHSFRRRISVLDLQRLFTPSKSSSSIPQRGIENVPVSSICASGHESIPMSRSSSSTLQSVHDIFAGSTTARPCSFHAGPAQMPYSLSTPVDIAMAEGQYDGSDTDSMELHLESLHFDSLHFDPDEF
ncbi:hypothetical protein PHLCEN_2v5028 [Hermanssonia centrifuga]|uniref:Uncharacterized protein n=1 Tax=Hermanssonia centrifuga TaxID=98765 RepID=A0A2R6PC61_9APHY|nr:hypothetical protein PHLCEN_2v5028 [Hermanssonia centrifuga]